MTDGTTAPRRGYFLFLLCAIYSVNALDRNIIAILLQPIKQDLQLSDSQLGLLSGLAFAILYVTLAVPIARLADLWNRKAIIALSLSLFSVMTALCGLAANFWQLMIARISVGIGEAGTTPASASIIADLYPEGKRGTAMTLFAVGGCSGVFLGFALGGAVAEAHGWRTAFLVASFPGLLLALLLALTVREPERGAVAAAQPVRTVLIFIWRQRSLRHLTVGLSTMLLFIYGYQSWLPTHFQRTYGMSLRDTGFVMGIFYGILNMIGTLGAGLLIDRAARRDPRWPLWIVSIALLICFPFAALTALAPTRLTAVLAYALPMALAAVYIAPVYAVVQSLVPVRMRAMALAIVIAIANLVGMGMGPQIVGALSDLLRARLGAESLRHAMLLLTPVIFVAAAHFFWASRYLAGDRARVRE